MPVRSSSQAVVLTVLITLIGLAQLPVRTASAQSAPAEAPDPTRLDVERLPPEAAVLSRDMFAQGPFLQAEFGARGFVGGVGDLALPGLHAQVLFGYELTRWFMVGAALGLSVHATDAPPPPADGAFEVIDALAHLRLQWPISVRAALWLAGEGGLALTPGNLLYAYGLKHADELGVTYGGSLGFDWHLLSRHHSLGLLGGARLYPKLDGQNGERAIAIHGGAYLKYVF